MFFESFRVNIFQFLVDKYHNRLLVDLQNVAIMQVEGWYHIGDLNFLFIQVKVYLIVDFLIIYNY